MSDTATAALRTPLYDRHVAAGARIIEFGGWDMPVQYSGILAEHKATRACAGLFDICHMGELRVQGAGAGATLNRLLTRPVDTLRVGRARYAMMCAEDGTVIDDLITFRLADDAYWVVTNAGTRDGDVAWIREHLAADTELIDESDATAKIDIQGPKAELILARLVEDAEALRAIRFFGFTELAVSGIKALVSRSGYTGEDGFEIFCGADSATRLWDAVLEAGAGDGLTPVGLGARDTLRLEAGLPLYGHELSRSRTPVEAAMNWAIDPEGDYIGSAVHRGQVATGTTDTLVPILLGGRRAARGGDAIYAQESGGEPLGEVVSGSFCPTLDLAAGFAYIRNSVAETDRQVFVETRGKRQAATVAAKPLYRRPQE